ncbi:transcription antitermination factor NusB [Bacillus thermotolerans]|uniref:Transcription antitermination protein NusB n=1 Tax=Bacillus thermotolerans TaxID=1221996 RepID=A0A0F5HVH4_BACTR|nr:transcription antitermination factor NusB [Bacillus thermotolerans]KKB37243.1 Transcription termination protein NusB [Bacillus thermotolerans]KKB42959.1 Transcription termination protein NusB [Bacillus thermotolerans]
MKRRTAREKSLQALYQMDVSGASPEEAITNVLEDLPDNEYVRASVTGTAQHIEEIDGLIKENLERWSFDRLAKVDRNILRLAVFELKYMEDVPDKVAINEAVELAKQFSDDKSSKFINGVLSRIKDNM